MAVKKKSTKNRPTEFLVRVSDVDVADMLYKIIEESNPHPSRNSVIIECLKNYLPVMLERNEPLLSLKNIVNSELEELRRFIKKDMNSIKTLLLILSATQNVEKKSIGYIISQVEHILASQQAIATLPAPETELGAYDKLPERLEKELETAIKALIGED